MSIYRENTMIVNRERNYAFIIFKLLKTCKQLCICIFLMSCKVLDIWTNNLKYLKIKNIKKIKK